MNDLVKRLRAYADQYNDMPPYGRMVVGTDEILLEAAEAIEKNEKDASGKKNMNFGKRIYTKIEDYVTQVIENTTAPIGSIIINRTDVLVNAIRKYGKRSQVDMAIEEMSELIKALCKERRNDQWGDDNRQDAVFEEIADVAIMLQQLIFIFDHDGITQKYVDSKIARLDERMKRNIARKGN